MWFSPACSHSFRFFSYCLDKSKELIQSRSKEYLHINLITLTHIFCAVSTCIYCCLPTVPRASDCKISHWLTHFFYVSRYNGGPIEGPQYDSAVMYGDFRGCPQLGPHNAERCKSLRQLYVWYRCCFFHCGSLNWLEKFCLRNDTSNLAAVITENWIFFHKY